MSASLPHSPATILAEFLRQKNKVPSGHKLSVNGMQLNASDLALNVHDTESHALAKDMTGNINEATGVQVRIRGLPNEQLAPRLLLIEIGLYLDIVAREPLTFDTSQYLIHSIHRTSNILPLNADERRRWEWSWNGVIRITQTA